MTRSQRKQAYVKLKHALGRNSTRDEETTYGDDDGDNNNATREIDDDARDLNPIMNKLPDHY